MTPLIQAFYLCSFWFAFQTVQNQDIFNIFPPALITCFAPILLTQSLAHFHLSLYKIKCIPDEKCISVRTNRIKCCKLSTIGITDAALALDTSSLDAVTQGVPQGLVLGPLFHLQYCHIYYAHTCVNIKAIITLHLVSEIGALFQNVIRKLCQAEHALSTRTKCTNIQQALKFVWAKWGFCKKEPKGPEGTPDP